MSKTRAYTSQDGSVQVSARYVKEQRDRFFNGEPTPYSYFSLDPAGSRVPVKHMYGKSYPYFSYINSGGGGASNGESLNHVLFKEALSELERLRLDISLHVGDGHRKQVSIDMHVSKAEKEKQIPLPGGGFRRADVYYEFESDSWIYKKWGGELYIEVLNTSAVGALKQVDLRSVSAAVVEVEIPPIFEYKIPDEETTDDLEQKHREKIKRILQGERGFLKVRSLSNPSTKEYLIDRVKIYKSREALWAAERDELKTALSHLEQSLAEEISKSELIASELLVLKNNLNLAVQEKNSALSLMESQSVSFAISSNVAEKRLKKLKILISVMVTIFVFYIMASAVYFLV